MDEDPFRCHEDIVGRLVRATQAGEADKKRLTAFRDEGSRLFWRKQKVRKEGGKKQVAPEHVALLLPIRA